MYATLPSASVAPHFSHTPFSSSPISISILYERLKSFNDEIAAWIAQFLACAD